MIQLERQLRQQWHKHLQHQRLDVARLRALLKHPGQSLNDQSQRLDHIQARLEQAALKNLQTKHGRYKQNQASLLSSNPNVFIKSHTRHVMQLCQRLTTAQKSSLSQQSQRFSSLATQLNQLSPLHTLSRGYSVTQNEQGTVITETGQINAKQKLKLSLVDGHAMVKVEQVIPH